MFQLVWTGPARDDLHAINTWLKREVSAHHAVRTLVTIQQRARFLENFPHGGRPYCGELRILRVYGTPYLLRYRILVEPESVQVLRVHHEREDWSVLP